jgi:nucleoside-diphosphate-sugar epimerase
VSNRHVLIIGGAGFIGLSSADRFLNDGYQVTIVDDLSTSILSESLNKYRFYKLDAAQYSELEKVFSEHDFSHVLILSSVVEVPLTLADPRCVTPGIQSTVNALELCRRLKIGRIIYGSSGFVYGNQPVQPYTEEVGLMPENPYTIAKIFGEQICKFYENAYGLNIFILRYAPVYGPRRLIGPIADFVKKAKIGHVVSINPVVKRDYIFIDDVARANLLAANARDNLHDTYNICLGKPKYLFDIYKVICKIYGANERPIEPRATIIGEIIEFSMSPVFAAKKLGFTAEIDIEEGLSRTIEWYRESEDTSSGQ